MKNFLLALTAGGLMVFLLTITDAVWGHPLIIQISNALFVVGIFLFFIGLIMLSAATDIFISFGYTFKVMFRRDKLEQKDFHDYSQARQKERGKYYGISIFLVGIIFVAVAQGIWLYTR